MTPASIKVSIGAICLLGAFGGGYKLRDMSADMDVSRLERDAAINAQIAANKYSEEVLANDLLKNRLSAERIENQAKLDDARRRLAGVRVLLPAAICSDYGQADTAGGSAIAAPDSGVLPEPIEGAAGNPQRAMDEFIAGLKADAEVMDGVVEMCRVVAGWAKGL